MHILIWDAHTRTGHNIDPYAYGISHTRMGRPIRVWAHIRIWGRTSLLCCGVSVGPCTLQYRRKRMRLSLLYKCINNLIALKIPHYFTLNPTLSRIHHQLSYNFSNIRTDSYINSYFPRTIIKRMEYSTLSRH